MSDPANTANGGVVDVDIWLTEHARSGTEMRAAAGIEGEPHTNVSHTRGLTVAARAVVPVGIDVELVRPHRHLERLARRTMHDAELAEWSRATDKVRAFTQHWTRVEAYLKALGVGIRGGLLTRPERVWAVIDLDLGDAHCGAVAVASGTQPVRLHCHRI